MDDALPPPIHPPSLLSLSLPSIHPHKKSAAHLVHYAEHHCFTGDMGSVCAPSQQPHTNLGVDDWCSVYHWFSAAASDPEAAVQRWTSSLKHKSVHGEWDSSTDRLYFWPSSSSSSAYPLHRGTSRTEEDITTTVLIFADTNCCLVVFTNDSWYFWLLSTHVPTPAVSS